MDALNQDFPQILKHKSSLPFFDHNKTSAREIASHRDLAPSYEGSVMHDAKQFSMKKTMERSKNDDAVHESTIDFKGMFKDMASFSAQDHRNQEHTDGQQTSPKRAKGSLKNGDDSMNNSKLLLALNAPGKPKTKSQEKEDQVVVKSPGKENNKRHHQHKKSEGDLINKLTQKKKKADDKYEISDLDNTQEIVRKTDVAVRTLAKRSEKVKREIKNFEENVKTQLKENESAPINSLRAVNLVRDFVFNEEEFAKLIEEEDMEEEREKAQREYNQRKGRKAKKSSSSVKPPESKIKAFNNTATARFHPFPQASPRNDDIIITKEEKMKIEQTVEKYVVLKEEELKKQVELQLRIHEKYGVFSNENNLFRINSANYTKLMKEKEKLREQLLYELKNSKYKERESKKQTAQSHRIRPINSDRPSQHDCERRKDEEKCSEDTKSDYLKRIQEVLTKPEKNIIGNKYDDFNTHAKRLDFLRKKYTTTDIERVNQATYHNL